MPENTPKTPNGNPGTVPSRSPDASGDPRAHHEVAATHGTASANHRPDPRGLRESDPQRPYTDTQRPQVRTDVAEDLRRYRKGHQS